MGIDIRFMEKKDVTEVVAIEKSIFSMPWSETDFLNALDHPQNIYIVVEEQGIIQGYCGLWAVLEEGQITNVAIRMEKRGQGYGYQMMEKLLQIGDSRGLEAFTLEVREGNHRARKLYAKLGFEESGIRPNFYDKPKENAVIMWKWKKKDE